MYIPCCPCSKLLSNILSIITCFILAWHLLSLPTLIQWCPCLFSLWLPGLFGTVSKLSSLEQRGNYFFSVCRLLLLLRSLNVKGYFCEVFFFLNSVQAFKCVRTGQGADRQTDWCGQGTIKAYSLSESVIWLKGSSAFEGRFVVFECVNKHKKTRLYVLVRAVSVFSQQKQYDMLYHTQIRKKQFVVYEHDRSAVLCFTIYGWKQEDIFLQIISLFCAWLHWQFADNCRVSFPLF